MQSSTYRRENSYISLGERRGKLDLAQFSLDLSWARAVSDSSRSRAYPSPPMSGSPPLPPRRNPDASDRGHGSYGSSGQDVFRGQQTSQSEQQQHIEQSRGPPTRGFQDQQQLPPFTPYRLEDMVPQVQYQPQRPQMIPQQQLQHSYPPQPPPPFSTVGAPPIGEVPDYSSPKAHRKTKGHVASACVPCKRAHLRCDAQRPCSRCLTNGKEETCIDVQHKKRGRPRLRDEREPRYEGLGPNYAPPPQEPMRRPLSLYNPTDTSIATPFGDALQRSSSYRVLKSQGGGMGGPIAPRFMEHHSPADPNIYTGSIPPAPRIPPTEPMCAFLTMDMQVAKATQGFGEMIGVHSVIARKVHDIVSGSDRDKIFRLQRIFDEERREREPNYLPPIYLKFEEDRVIQSVGFGPEEMHQFRTDRQETITFQGPDGEHRTFQVRLGLAKKDSTYFIIIMLNSPVAPPVYQQPSSHFSREPYARDTQYGYQPLPGYNHPQASSFMPNPAFGDSQGNVQTFRQSGPLGSNIAASANTSNFTQAPPRDNYSQQIPYQTPRSELPEAQGQVPSQRQRDLQLPPIRDQRSDNSSGRREDRGRFDIGGLLEDPAGRGR